MARRLQTLNGSTQVLKKGYKRNVIFSPIQHILPMIRRKPTTYDIECGAIHDLDNSLVRVKFGLFKNKQQIIPGGNGYFTVSAINRADMTETIVYTSLASNTTTDMGWFVASFTEGDVAGEFIGEQDYLLEVFVDRMDRTFNKRFYFNALGLFDFALRIKKKVTFLEITKKSVGE